MPALRGEGHLHLWLGGFKGVVALGTAVGQAVGLVVWITLVAVVAVAVVGVCVVESATVDSRWVRKFPFSFISTSSRAFSSSLVDVLGLQVARVPGRLWPRCNMELASCCPLVSISLVQAATAAHVASSADGDRRLLVGLFGHGSPRHSLLAGEGLPVKGHALVSLPAGEGLTRTVVLASPLPLSGCGAAAELLGPAVLRQAVLLTASFSSEERLKCDLINSHHSIFALCWLLHLLCGLRICLPFPLPLHPQHRASTSQ